jgi:amino acid adenylation domain-containing protein
MGPPPSPHAGPGRPVEPPLRARQSDTPIPLTFAQEVLWLLHRSNPALTAYNEPVAWRVRGTLDVAALARAICMLIGRHESLRTVFDGREGGPVQVVLPAPAALTIAVHDVGLRPPPEREGAAFAALRVAADAPFDLAREPGFRVAVARIAADDHVLLFVIHHIVTDFASRGVMWTELSALYDAEVCGIPADLPPVALQFGDFAVWQREMLSGDRLEERLAYWRERLADLPTLDLPADFGPRGAVGFEGATVRAHLADGIVRGIRACARAQDTTPFMVFLATLQAVLCRICGQDDVVVGSPVAGRVRGKTDTIVGYFAQALPMRTHLDGNPTFAELLKRVRRTVLEAVRHQDVPMEALVQDLQRRQSRQAPLIRVALSMHGPSTDLRLGSAHVAAVEIEHAEAKFDLSMLVTDDEQRIELEVSYRTALFHRATAERFLTRVIAAVEQMIADPARRVSEIELLTANEQADLDTWNETDRAYDRTATLDSLIAKQVALSPNAIAVMDDSQSLSFADVARRAAAVATRLRQAGVTPRARVAVFADRRVDLVPALLGILQVGAAYVPVDPDYPAERIRLMLGDSAVAAILVDESVAGRLPPADAPYVFFDDALATAVVPAAAQSDPAAPAYVLYTSGSTGRPKGVVISHRAVVNHMTWMNAEFPLGASDVVLQKTPMAFDASVWEFWAPLMAGARVRFAASGGHRDSHYLAGMLAGGEVSVAQFVPALLEAVLDEPGFVPNERLTRVFCGGERLTRALVTRFRGVSTATLVNLYGPTETTIDATSWTQRAGDAIPAVIPVGRPIANTRAYVLDAHQRRTPVGVPGELYIGGEGVADGYLFNEALTAERFLPNPFLAGQRVYRTGDLVRHLPGGNLQYLGRTDDQLKIRGVRIEPGEVEATLRTHPGVRECAVVARAAVGAGDARLVGYYVARSTDGTVISDAASVGAFLRERLPDYLVPASLTVLDAMPLTPNGKIDRRALQARETFSGAARREHIAPRAGVERDLADMWEALLDTRPIGADSDFFELGGHSLLAMRVLARIGDRWGLRLPMRAIFDAPTLGALAERILAGQRGASTPASGVVAVAPAPLGDDAQAVPEWNDTGFAFGEPTTMVAMIAASAARRPAEIAVVSGDVALTWAELSARAHQLAHRLQALGVGPDVPVGICLDRSVDLVVAMYGILVAGGAYVSLLPDLPAARIARQCSDSGTALVVTSLHHRGVLPEGVRALVLDLEAEALAEWPAFAPVCAAGPANLAYVLFTSGSTGVPKGVAVTHANLVHYTRAIARVLDLDLAGESMPWHFASVSTLAADLGHTSVFPALASAGTLHVLAGDVLTDAARFHAYLTAHPIDVLKITPNHFQALTGSDPGVTHLLRRWLVLGGEALPLRLAHALVGAARCRVLNHYGPTEGTVGMLTFEVTADSLARARAQGAETVPLGHPIANMRAYVVDADGVEQAVGVTGELWAAGDGLASGYFRQPELTAVSFVEFHGQRVYRTGDRVRRLADGNLEFLGRADDQIKVRGYRVELGEIEHKLRAYPGVESAVVVYRADAADGAAQLVAYAVAKHMGDGGDRPAAGMLASWLTSQLPAHMVPDAVLILDALPLTANGKVDRAKLPAPERGVAAVVPYVAPRTPTEEAVAAIWRDVLGRDRVGVTERFLDLGGHSLLAIRVFARVSKELGVPLGLRTMLETPTVEQMAATIDAERERSAAGAASTAAERIPRRTGSGPYELSHGQELLWLIEQIVPTVAYAVPRLYRVRGVLDVTALRTAHDALVARHEVLRTRVVDTPQGPRQVIDSPRRVPYEEIDVRGSLPAERDAVARQLLAERMRRPFDLGADLMLRLHVARLSEDEWLVLLLTHHIASDEGSRYVLHRELSALYDAALDGRAAVLPSLSIQYADYAVWQRAALERGALAGQLAYWREQLRDAQPLVLPTDRARPPMIAFPGASRHFALPARQFDALARMSRDCGTTLFMTMSAAFAVLMHRISGQDDIVVGSPVTSRRFVELEGLIGYFPNIVALRTRFGGDPAFAEVLRATRETTLDALERCDVPLEKLALELRQGSGHALEPLFRVAFVFQAPDTTELRLRGASVGTEPAETGASKFDITLFVAVREGELSLTFEYRTDLYDAATIDRLFGQFETLLGDVVRRPDVPVSHLALLPDAERRLVVDTWNATTTDYPRDAFVHELAAACAAQREHEVAVASGDVSLTYGALASQSDALARELAALGVARGDRVALFAERWPSLIVAMLGVLKASAAYVPLEPEYPAARLLFMLEDSDARVVLVQRHLESAFAGVLGAADSGVADAVRPRVFYIDADGQIEGAVSRPAAPAGPAVRATPADASADAGTRAAYVMYTSGSTGKPKGVVVTHRGIVRLVRNTNFMRFTVGDVMLGFAPSAFDAATLEVWGALLNGGRLVLAPPRLLNLSELAELIEERGVTTAFFAAALFSQIVEAGLERYGSVRQLLAGGDVLSAPHVRRALAALPDCQVINGYGPTENTTFTCCYSVPRDWPAADAVPIGRPISNTRAYVLDAHRNPVPIGVAGELYAGGDGVALGYLDRPALTAERFVADPFSAAPNARLYRTGDRVRWRSDGAIEFLGRADDQVKIRGFRVEPGEVEATLAALSGVREAAIVVRRDAAGQKQLVAYIVPKQGSALTSADVRASLRTRLPAHMIPAAVVQVPAFPVTANGKLDRAALPEPSLAVVTTGRLAVAPRTRSETQLLRIWESLLAHRPIGIDDDFFEIGGHSLLALRMLADIERACGRRLALTVLFENATIEHLANRVDALVFDEPEPPVVILQPHGSATPFAFLHGDWSGAGWYCRQLAPLLSADVPLIVLPTLRDGAPGSPLTIEAMAAVHVETLLRAQPNGPYRIGGFCVGGLVALELARELARRGEVVERLIMIDTVNRNAGLGWLRGTVGAFTRGETEAERFDHRVALLEQLQYYAARVNAVKGMGARERARWAARVVQRLASRALGGASGTANASVAVAQVGAPPAAERPDALTLRAQTRAAVTYMPRAYDGEMELIFSANPGDQLSEELATTSATDSPPADARSIARGWDRVSRAVHVHHVMGTHHGILGEHVGKLAECLRACLRIG